MRASPASVLVACVLAVAVRIRRGDGLHKRGRGAGVNAGNGLGDESSLEERLGGPLPLHAAQRLQLGRTSMSLNAPTMVFARRRRAGGNVTCMDASTQGYKA